MLEKSLPSEYYRSPEIFAKERERIFSREWVCAGRADELPRGRGSARARESWAKVCCSRGRARAGSRRTTTSAATAAPASARRTTAARPGARAPLGARRRLPAEAPAPSGVRITPGRTRWTAGSSERRFSTRIPTLRAEDLSLHACAIAEWGGFFFLNLWPAGPRARSLEPCLGAVPERVRRYPLDRLRLARRIVYEVGANWKVVAENYNECYHCAGVHPELCEVVPAFREKGGAGLDWEHGIPHRDGAFTFTRSGTSDRALFPDLSEEEKTRHKGELVYPNLFLSLSPEHVAAFRLAARGARPDADLLRLPLRRGRDREARVSTPRTPSSSGTSSTGRTGRSAKRSSAASASRVHALRLLRPDGGR